VISLLRHSHGLEAKVVRQIFRVTSARSRLARLGGRWHIARVGSGISPTSPVEPARAAAGRDAGRARALAIVPRHARWLDGHLARLRALPAHGNRVLRADQLFLGLLLASFDPLARSLRLVEDAADFGGRLDLPRLARSTTADALAARSTRRASGP
jgi:hypothetical protein